MCSVIDYNIYFPDRKRLNDRDDFIGMLESSGATINETMEPGCMPDAVMTCCTNDGQVPQESLKTVRLECKPLIGIASPEITGVSNRNMRFDLILDWETSPVLKLHRLLQTIRLFRLKQVTNNMAKNLDINRLKLDKVVLFGTQLAETLSRHELFDLIVNYADKVLPLQTHILYTTDNVEHICRLRAVHLSAEHSHVSPLPSFRISAETRDKLASAVTPELFQHPFHSLTSMKTLLDIFINLQSVLITPLVSKRHLMGFVISINTCCQKDISETDIEQLGILGTFSSISLANAFVYEQTEVMSSTDKLTTVYNFGFIKRFLEQLISNQELFSLVFIDLDGFKHINLKHGHLFGNQALRRAAAKIVEFLKPYNICGRFGGDEFVIVMPGVDVSCAATQTGVILENIATLKNELGITVSASAGIAEYPSDADNLDAIIHSADTAMYGAKEQGGSHSVLYRNLCGG